MTTANHSDIVRIEQIIQTEQKGRTPLFQTNKEGFYHDVYVKKENVKAELKDGTLTIAVTAEQEKEEKDEKEHWIRK